MAVLEVGRLHARYDRSAAGTAMVLDDALRRVAEDGLAHELISHPLDAAYAVCIRRLSLRVNLDPRQPVGALSRRWAAAIVAALEDRVAGSDDVVVYRREIDALVDVVRSAATGDRTRTWAWHQIGLLAPSAPWPSPGDVAEVLARRPHLAPATVAAAPDLAARALDAEGWLTLARVVHETVGRPAVTSASPTRGMAAATWTAADRVRAVVPEAAWDAAAGPDERVALAVLALACVAPARCRDPHTVGLVASVLGPTADDPSAETGVPHAADEAREADRPGARVSDPSARATPSGPTTGTDTLEPTVSRHGGVLFLVHAVTALDLAAEPRVLARVLAAAASVEPDDPAVLAAAGWRRDDPTDVLAAPLPPDDEERVAEDARQLRAWVAGRLDPEHEAGTDADLAWVWARRAVIDAQPGWVEATFALDDVDLRLRVAGLDLDPGVVWWLGSVVRFRYE